MSVLKKDQRETDVWYLTVLVELCSEAGAMLEKRKKDKFHNAYAPAILDLCIKMYNEAELGNNIVISKICPFEDFEARRRHFQIVLGHLSTYENLVRLYVVLCIKNKSFNEQKGFKFLESNSSKIAKLRTSIVRIIKKDTERVRKLNREKIIIETKIAMQAQQNWYQEQIQKRKDEKKIIQPIIFDNYPISC